MGIGRIPNRLKKYRRMKGYTQKQVALKLGMKKSDQVCAWEQGTASPNLRHLLQLSRIYQVLIEELYFPYLQDLRREPIPDGTPQDYQ